MNTRFLWIGGNILNNTDYSGNDHHTGFHLNLQIIADDFADKKEDVSIICHEDPLNLDGLRIYQPGTSLKSCYLYLIFGTARSDEFRRYKDIAFAVIGGDGLSFFPESCRILHIKGNLSFSEIFNQIQQTFEKYYNWDIQLQLALGNVNPLDEMLEASLDIFHNPVFAHDTNFYILSSPRHVAGMSEWIHDKRTGRLIAPLNLIQDFKLDAEYQRTLATHGANIYSEELRGYRILYMNLWVNGSYQGRLCVDELQTEIRPGHFFALEYLGSFIELCIRRHNLFQISLGNDTHQFFADYLSGKISELQEITDRIQYLNWNRHDRYLILRLETQQQDDRMHSSIATLGHIEAQIPEGFAFTYQQGIVVIVNLSFDHSSASDMISSLAIIMREGLFKMGVSSEFRDFLLIPQGYMQAVSALRLGKKSQSMIWCYRFDDYLLEYMLSRISHQISPELLVSSRLAALQDYDHKNNTELCRTLKVYLEHERNSLQTAKVLFIHRSSLTYRLERIQKITRIDLDNPKERLLVLLCFQLIQEQDPEVI